MPVVTIEVTDAADAPVEGALVVIRAIGSGSEPVFFDGALIKPLTLHTNASGQVTPTLPANALCIPSESYYTVEVTVPSARKSSKNKIQVPNGAGPYLWRNILHEPGTIETSALAAHKLTVGDHTDVDLTGNAVGKVLMWDGTNFVPGDTVATDIEAASLVAAEAALRTTADANEATARATGDADTLAAAAVDATTKANAAKVFVNVEDFGAIGDGVADDTAAIQATFDEGGTIFFPPGKVFATTAPLNLGSVDVVGYGASILFADPTPPPRLATVSTVMFITAPEGATIKGLTIDGDNKAIRGIYVSPTSRGVNIEDVEVANITQGAGETTSAVGVRIAQDVVGASVLNCSIHDITAPNTGVARGIMASYATAGSSSDLLFQGNRITDISPEGDADGIVVQDFTNYVGCRILDNHFLRCHKRAVKIQSPGVVCSGNTIENSYRGVAFSEPAMRAAISVLADDVTVEDNIVRGGEFGQAIEAGATGQTYARINISGNVVKMGSDITVGVNDLIRVYGTVNKLDIIGNILERGRVGIYLSAVVNNCIVALNTIGDCTQSAINHAGSSGSYGTDVSILGNSYTGIADYGVTSGGGTRVSVRNNQGQATLGTHNPTTLDQDATHGLSGDHDSRYLPLGFPFTIDPALVLSGGQAFSFASRCVFLRWKGRGAITKIGLEVVVSSGNIGVAVYSSTGSGRDAVPGTRKATTGEIACPAIGYAEVALPVTIEAGDWVGFSCDNTTATFRAFSSLNNAFDLAKGVSGYQNSGHPPPSSPTITIGISKGFALVGVP